MDHADVPSCQECLEWLYDKDWKIVRIAGQKQKRNGGAVPCWKCPKGPRPFENEPTLRTLLALDYYHLCQVDGTGLLPRDRRVLFNNVLINRVREQAVSGKLGLFPLLMLTARGKS